jgi:hypothetical protein
MGLILSLKHYGRNIGCGRVKGRGLRGMFGRKREPRDGELRDLCCS